MKPVSLLVSEIKCTSVPKLYVLAFASTVHNAIADVHNVAGADCQAFQVAQMVGRFLQISY